MAPVPRTKNGFEPKSCAVCQRPFEWRKKWARDWESVKYCSQACRDKGPKSRKES